MTITLDPSSGTETVPAELHPPAGRRRHHLVLVRHCPHCGYAHTHRTAVVVPYYRRSPSCASHRTYLLHITGMVSDE